MALIKQNIHIFMSSQSCSMCSDRRYSIRIMPIMDSVCSYHICWKTIWNFLFVFLLSRSFTFKSLVIPWPGADRSGRCARTFSSLKVRYQFLGADEFSNRYNHGFVATKKILTTSRRFCLVFSTEYSYSAHGLPSKLIFCTPSRPGRHMILYYILNIFPRILAVGEKGGRLI